MAKKESNQHIALLQDIRNKVFKPIYLLMGDESYYIDMICDAIIENALKEEERDFNQTILYGADIDDFAVVVNAAKRFPMMADHQLIVVKEAQNIRGIDNLSYYLQKPQMRTILVICYKNGSLKNKKIVAGIEKIGVVYESKKLYDSQLPAFINTYVVAKKLSIDPKAVSMMADFVGNDLSRLSGELDKLTLSLPEGSMRITPELVERNVGISKDYNNYELLNAIVTRNVSKAARIVQYFEQNPKNNPLVVTIGVLFNFFANLMICYFAADRSEGGIAKELNLRSVYQSRDYLTAMRNYNAFKCIDIIALIRQYDARSKGIGSGASSNDGDLLKELVFKIIYTPYQK
ncbi:DNA polymerase III subunit delta [Barnesiella sp. An55]|uniref:DNA polymerase III subunit delta n=1 Tax=Barnesiella sp. An55 TaxID=1965646 RepID=UPI000B388C34|nr:DNA polymerase III subunit delta [Barnesiella sp. An55]OUN74874.1 DNA polymerase III subunit delta [Barnesiella sp. An55]HIZ26307.1 DNA polymerase III subunit delta [Candidatus Barnesiella merdipullorum]